MSDFIEDQAAESDHDEEEDEGPVRKKPRKRKVQSSDEEEEEEDDEEIAREMGDFVVTGDDEEEEERDKESEKSAESDEEEELSDADLELVRENLGEEAPIRPSGRGRVHIEDDDVPNEEDVRARIANQLFDNEEEELPELGIDKPAYRRPVPADDDDRSSESGESDGGMQDFIAPEPGEVLRRPRRKSNKLPISNAQLDEAREIFGVDFEYGKFFDQDEEQAEEDEEELEEEYPEEEDEGRERRTARRRKKPQKESLLEHIEPAEIERGFLSEQDTRIQLEDKPERFQLRRTPVTEADKEELELEAPWIYTNAFCTAAVSLQDQDTDVTSILHVRPAETVKKILQALDFMRCQNFEVPFVAFYRKEYVEQELGINDLWKVFQWDEKWCQLQIRKRNLIQLYRRMQSYQFDKMSRDPNEQLSDDVRLISDDDFSSLEQMNSLEELQDFVAQFMLYYGTDVPKMAVWEKEKTRLEDNAEEAEKEGTTLKQASRKDAYSLCLAAGLAGMAAKFGLSPKHLGENLEEDYTRHEVEQYPVDPLETANDYLSRQFPTPQNVLEGAKYMVAKQLSREPSVRHAIREQFKKKAMVSVRATKKGRKEIDENHVIYTKKYMKNKPISDLEKDEFLKLVQAEESGLVEMTMHADKQGEAGEGTQPFVEEVIDKKFYHRDEYSSTVKDWNNVRDSVLKICMENMLFPLFKKEMRLKLLQEARDYVVKECCLRLYNWLKTGPYQPDAQIDENDEDDLRFGVRVMGIAYPSEKDQASFCCVIDGEGGMLDYMRLVHFTKRKKSFKEEERRLKEEDLEYLKKLIMKRKPHVVALGAENLDALVFKEELESTLRELEDSGQLSRRIPVEIMDNELAKVFMNSKRAEAEFKDYPTLLRQAVSLARRLQDPLPEFCQMCTPDEEILCCNYHPLQDQVPKEDLLAALMLEFINRVNEVGVDINRCLEHTHAAPMLQFVCGLGPRKAAQLFKVLKQHDNYLENRTKLVTLCRMGPKVFMNCAGFIKIDTAKLSSEKQDAFVELLDGTRVHPETYEWARKMAIDALEVDEDDHAANALELILDQPEKLKDLDLDAFAEELKRQGFGNKEITLYDIRAELNHRYKDLRVPYRPPQKEEIFNLLTKETPQTFNVGKLVMGRVMRVVYRKPTEEQTNNTNPVRDESTGFWQCPLCLKNDFSELSDVWSHFDQSGSGGCPGQAVGVKVRLENGITGFIPTKYISDKHVENPNERVAPNMPVYCRVLKVDTDRFQAELSCRSSDLADREAQFRPPKDHYYDFKTEEVDRVEEEALKAASEKSQYVKRVIAHPSFHNIAFKDAEKMLATMDQGEVVIRPSSKGWDHLTVTWKVTGGVCQHIDVREEGKEKPFSLGKSLWIGEEEFEDLDEIVARHIQPMAALVRDILSFKYFQELSKGRPAKDVLKENLEDEKRKNPARIPYLLSVSRELPGKFMLSYLPRSKVRHEYVSVTPDGFRFRQQIFPSLASLFKWFKEHFRDPVPGATPAHTGTPMDNASSYGNAAATPRFDPISATPGGGNPWAMRPPNVMSAMPRWDAFAPPQMMDNPRYAIPDSQMRMRNIEENFPVPHERVRTPRSSVGSDWADSARNWASGRGRRDGGWYGRGGRRY